MTVDIEALKKEFDTLGLRLRGVLSIDGFGETEPPPAIQGSGVPNETSNGTFHSLLIIGNIGNELWARDAGAYPTGGGEASSGSTGEYATANPEHMNEWTRQVIDPIAARLGGVAYYPFGGPPYHPFQRWAMQAEPVTPSPIGMLIHPDFGLWHAYRAAIAVPESVDPPPPDERANPCLTCPDEPCLSTCPVDAFKDMRNPDGGYDVPACAAHIARDAGRDCLTQGCRARRACPIGRGFHYVPGQAEYHMQAFLRARQP